MFLQRTVLGSEVNLLILAKLIGLILWLLKCLEPKEVLLIDP